MRHGAPLRAWPVAPCCWIIVVGFPGAGGPKAQLAAPKHADEISHGTERFWHAGGRGQMA